MTRTALVFAVAAFLFIVGPATSQLRRREPARSPKAEPVAETRLLMEALNQANFRGLERLLKDQPADAELADACPLRDNAFKIPMARNALVSLLRDLAEGRDHD